MSLSEHFKTDGSPKVSMTVERAYAVAEDMRANGKDMQAYECSYCGDWHVGRAETDS